MYRVFYSRDNGMFGVERHYADREKSGRGAHWAQVLPPKGKGARGGKSAYTYYEAVAERWAEELRAGDV